MVLVLHRRAGKTELAIMQLLDSAMRCELPLGQFFYAAPFLKQAKTNAWKRLKKRTTSLIPYGAVTVNESDLSITFAHNGATVRVYGADNPDAIRGVHLDGVVIDEVAQTKPHFWDDVIQPALSDRLGWALFIGTPSGTNLFSELYFRASSGDDPDWGSALYTVYDTDALVPDEVARLRRDMSELSFSREYLCDFSASGDDQLISLSDVDAASRIVYTSRDVDYAPRILGVDPARFGDDRSVIFPRQGLQAFPPLVFRGLDNMELASRVADKIDQWRPDAVFIDAGGGAGVIDRLRKLRHDVIEVPFGGRSSQPQYLNKRAEMWFAVRDWIRAGGAVPTDAALRQDLSSPVYWHDAADKLVIEPKDAIKGRGLPSPDLGDALALTFASPVEKRSELSSLMGGARDAASPDYDPYQFMRRT